MLKIFIFLLSLNSFAQEVQLKKGPIISMTKMWGDVSVLCYDDVNQNWQKIYCFQYHIDGGNSDQLEVIGQSIDASHVIIERVEDSYSQSSRFNTKLQQSESSFVLWEPGLNKQGLLKLGLNSLNVYFKTDDQVVHRDIMTIELNVSAEKECETGILSYPNNCPENHFICAEYFQKNNSCKSK